MAATRTFALLACFLGLGGVAQAIDLAAIPSCGIKCVLQDIGLSDCAITNQTCLCTNEIFISQVEKCVVASCTVKDMLVVKNQTDSACGVSPAEVSHVMRYVRAFLLVFPTIPLIMRIANKCMKISPWGWDDTTIMIAFATLSVFIPVGYLSENAGTGRDIWTLTPDQITENLFIFYIASKFYITGLAAIKASILFLYLRIFPEAMFRKVLWYTQLVNLLGFIAFITAAIFACQPVSYFWTGWTKETKGKCLNVHVFSEGHGGFNVILDVWMLLLPLSQIYNLNLRLQKKLGVMLMFGIGVFLTAVSAYRMYVLQDFAQSYNFTAGSFQTSIWSLIELAVGIFVACLPSTRGVSRILFSRFVQKTHISSKTAGSTTKNIENSRQTPRTRSSGRGRLRAVSIEESSISDLVVEDLSKIPMHDLTQLSPAVTGPSQTSKVPMSPQKEEMVAHSRQFSMELGSEPNEHGDGQPKV